MIYKRGDRWWMDNVINGVRYRESLVTTNQKDAKNREKERVNEILQGRGAGTGPKAKLGFNAATDEYIEHRKLHSAEKSCRTDRERGKALRRFFADSPLKRITAEKIEKFQGQRLAGGVSGRTINMEVGLLRRILKRFKQWNRIADDVTMLPETPQDPRVLTSEEKNHLLAVAQSRPEWEVVYYATVLALNTTMRGCELRGLRWQDINVFDKTLVIRRGNTKTEAGARVIPLNQSAISVLKKLRLRGELLGGANPEHHVFPSCEHGHVDVSRPTKGWRTAWRRLTEIANLKGFRFHDLRHHAITELAEMGLSDQTIMSIAGHVSRRMLDHYSHIRLDAKRQALDALDRPSKDQPYSSQAVGTEVV